MRVEPHKWNQCPYEAPTKIRSDSVVIHPHKLPHYTIFLFNVPTSIVLVLHQ